MPAPTLEQLQDAVAELISGERETTRREIDLIKGANTETRQRLEKLDDIVRSLEVANKAELFERDLASLAERLKAATDQPYAMTADVTQACESLDRSLKNQLETIAQDVRQRPEIDIIKELEKKIEGLSIDVGVIDTEKDELTKEIATTLELVKEIEEKQLQQHHKVLSAIENQPVQELPELPDIEGVFKEREAIWVNESRMVANRQDRLDEQIACAAKETQKLKTEIDEWQKKHELSVEALKASENTNKQDTDKQITELVAAIKDLQEYRTEQKEKESTLMADIDSKLGKETEKWSEKMATEFERARLGADLWKETTKHEIGRIDLRLEESSELFDALTSEIETLTAKKTDLEELYKSVLDQRMEHLGGYKPGREYQKGQMVCRDGATFICVVEKTDIDPREKTDEPNWRLMAAKGEPGPAIKPGKGDQGGPGKPGKDGVSFLGAEIKGGAIVLVSSDGQAHRIDLTDTIETVVDSRLAQKQVDEKSNKK